MIERILTDYGDYDTPDGTCLRDYIHVVDLAVGHVKALEYAQHNRGVEAINLGAGVGVSVLDLVKTFERVNGITLPYIIGPRRSGDLPAFWADAKKAKELLNWQAVHTLDDMCISSWKYAQNESNY